jgi:hypothetical protein
MVLSMYHTLPREIPMWCESVKRKEGQKPDVTGMVPYLLSLDGVHLYYADIDYLASISNHLWPICAFLC